MKDFKTIMIRGLDQPENKPLVEIMNSVIQRYPDINTGQAVIEFLIKDWDKTKKELQYQIRLHNEHEKACNDVIDSLRKELYQYMNTVTNFKNALKALNTIK